VELGGAGSRTFSSHEAAWPSSSKAITTTAAPCFCTIVACFRNASSPSLSEIEFTMHLPCTCVIIVGGFVKRDAAFALCLGAVVSRQHWQSRTLTTALQRTECKAAKRAQSIKNRAKRAPGST
jgi:hypothetical protein